MYYWCYLFKSHFVSNPLSNIIINTQSVFNQFLRVLNRLARLIFRKNRITEEEALNAVIVYLARSSAAPKPPYKGIVPKADFSLQAAVETSDFQVQETRPTKDAIVEAKAATAVAAVQAAERQRTEDRRTQTEPEKAEEKEQQIASIQTEQFKKKLQKVNYLVADEFVAKVDEEIQVAERSVKDEAEYLDRKCYELFRFYTNVSK